MNLNTNQPNSLSKYVLGLFRKAGKIDGRDVPFTKTPSPHSDPAVSLHCVKHFFASNTLENDSYCFMPSDHKVSDFGRPSFKQFQEHWAREGRKSGKGDDRFPEVRKRNASDPFSRCTLQCVCGPCSQGEAKELRCEAYNFGDDHMVRGSLPVVRSFANIFKILIHQFLWEGQTWAAILGTRDNPEEYSIWGKVNIHTKQTSYHDRILLKEVARAKPPKRHGRQAFVSDEDDEYIPEPEHPKERVESSTASSSSKARRTAAGSTGKKQSASKDIEQSGRTAMCTPISDDNENLKLSELSRKAVASPIDDGASSAVSPVPARASPLQQAFPNIQQPHEHNLQESFLDTQAYVYSRVDKDGKPVICSNAALVTYMKVLEDAADKNDAHLFRSIRATIARALVKAGLPSLPDL